MAEVSTEAVPRRWVGDVSSRLPAVPLRSGVPQWLDALNGAAIDTSPDVAATSA